MTHENGEELEKLSIPSLEDEIYRLFFSEVEDIAKSQFHFSQRQLIILRKERNTQIEQVEKTFETQRTSDELIDKMLTLSETKFQDYFEKCIPSNPHLAQVLAEIPFGTNQKGMYEGMWEKVFDDFMTRFQEDSSRLKSQGTNQLDDQSKQLIDKYVTAKISFNKSLEQIPFDPVVVGIKWGMRTIEDSHPLYAGYIEGEEKGGEGPASLGSREDLMKKLSDDQEIELRRREKINQDLPQSFLRNNKPT